MRFSLIFIGLFIIYSCSEQKGWTEKNKQSFIRSCIKENMSVIGADDINKYCECMQRKVQQRYGDYKDADRLTMSQNVELSDSCVTRGWAEAEKNAFMSTCSETRQSMGDNKEQADSYCDCMMQKIQTKYPDVTKTGNIPNEEMTAMATDCIQKRKQ